MAESIVIGFLVLLMPVLAWLEHRQNIRRGSLENERLRRMQ